MLKLHLGAPAGKSYTNLACDALMNWQHYDLAAAVEAAKRGTPVWPMLRRADGAHLDRLDGWRAKGLPTDHVMLMNEPFEPMQDGFKDPARAAEWATAAEFLADLGASTKLIVGGFLITYSPTATTGVYDGIRARTLDFARDFGDTENVIWAFHLYFPEVPADVTKALDWYAAQLDAIRADFPRFAITEAGVLRSGYSQRDRDIAALTALMQGEWKLAQERGCYAYGWYLATPNRYTGQADYVLTDAGGALRKLGEVYRDLRSEATPEPPTEPDAMALIAQLRLRVEYLHGYAQGHPNVPNAELLAQLRDLLKATTEEVK